MKKLNLLETSEREVFILRIWRSFELNAPLRGQIQHIGSGRTIAVQEPEEILRLIQDQVNATFQKKSVPSKIK